MKITNVYRLALHRFSSGAIHAGGGFADGVRILSDKDAFMAVMRDANEWAAEAVRVVRSAADPNPWRESSDEEIAGEILRQLEERLEAQGRRVPKELRHT